MVRHLHELFLPQNDVDDDGVDNAYDADEDDEEEDDDDANDGGDQDVDRDDEGDQDEDDADAQPRWTHDIQGAL